MNETRKRKPLTAVASAVMAVIGATAIATAIAGAAASAPSATDACASYQPQIPGASHFVDAIDNPYFPLPVGRVLVYRGSEDGLPQTDHVRVTKRTTTIEGITATVVHDVLRHRHRMLEETFDWYAQDDAGNVWYLGEDTKAFLPNGHVDRSGSWRAGVHGAKPGLIMEANPRPPDAYRQECLSGEAEDMAWVVERGGSVRVPAGKLHHIVRTFEFTRTEANIVSEKRYAPGLGLVVERDLHGGNERFALVRVHG
jgi:hypothetical protein